MCMCACVVVCVCVGGGGVVVHRGTFTDAQMQVNTLKNMAEHTNKPTTITMSKINMHTRHRSAHTHSLLTCCDEERRVVNATSLEIPDAKVSTMSRPMKDRAGGLDTLL